VSGQLALLNRNKADLGSPWDHWYAAPMVEGSAGHYWTPHLKTELEVATAGEGRIGVLEDMRYREHRLRETTLGATAVYQFFDNQWIHPFLGAGVEVARERHLVDALIPGRPLQSAPAIDRTSYSVRPVVAGGFKFYVNDRAFVRTEVRTSFSTERPLAIQWRGGVGFDF
jgi:outer membrane protein W